MLILTPDFARRIDLPGAGPCPRPVDFDAARTGFARLVSLRVYSFAAGVAIHGEAEGDEVFIVLMRGRAGVAITRDGAAAGDVALGENEGARVVYMPPHASYRLSATTDCDIAYARAVPTGAPLPAPRGFGDGGGRLDIADHAGGMALTLATLAAGDQCVEAAADERLLHVRLGPDTRVRLGDQALRDWDSAALDKGDTATIAVDAGTAELLTVRART